MKLVEVHAPSIGNGRLPTIVVVGAASRDLDPGDPRGWRLGGGVTYSAMALARLGIRVGAVIGLDEQAAAASELEVLRQAGVMIAPVRLARGPVFDNTETARGRIQLCYSVSDTLPATALPNGWATPGAALLNPVAGELGWRWAGAFGADTLVAVGWQGLLRRLEHGRAVEPRPLRPLALVRRADIATVSTEDAAAGGAPLHRLLIRPGQQLVVTSDRGMSVYLRRTVAGLRARSVPLRPAAVVRDPTGAGDVFLATWTAGLLAARSAGRPDEEAWRPLALAAAAAGAKVQVASLAEMAGLDELRRQLIRPPD